ncbi:response regulator [Neobacillus drentensis]|uniref:response regulator n=1 Tax=Neobacillus drentensis TaxID=220684 RepID=UPI002FFE4B2C
MDLNKYKNLLFQKIKSQISLWFESKDLYYIENLEVYRFLHSIHGSSGTIQLGGLHQLSGRLMNLIEETNQKKWEREELSTFLDDLISLTYEYEDFDEIEKNKELRQGENVPLIQIIDDDVSMLILLKDTLEEQGWMVVANTEPKKAMSQYFDLNPDCVIIDIHLQGINGFQVLDDLQNHNNQQFVPKIITSQLNDRKTRITAYKLGADDFIEKPIDLEELTVRIERLLKRKKLYDQAVLLNERSPLEITKKTLFVSVIDDDAIIRTILVRILKIMDFDHYELDFEAFEDGLQFFESKRLDKSGEHFLILDGVMPVMDGIEILQKVKKVEKERNIHVLMLTGRKSESDIERALKLGADDYVTKPFSIKELQARIERLIKRMK